VDAADIELKITAYGTEFLQSYTDAIETNFPGALEFIREQGLEASYFPLYERSLGVDTAFAVLFTSSDFYLFFLADRGSPVPQWEDVDTDPHFSRDWTFKTPDDLRIMQARDRLGIPVSSILQFSPGHDCVNIPGTNFLRDSTESMVRNGQQHGTNLETRLVNGRKVTYRGCCVSPRERVRSSLLA
jgi:hypothetical protein